MSPARFWAAAACAAVLLTWMLESNCYAGGRGKPRRSEIRDVEEGEGQGRIDWNEFSGKGATERARVVLFAANGRTLDDIAFRHDQVLAEVQKQGLLTEVVYPPTDREKLDGFRELCAGYGVKSLPQIVILAPDGEAVMVLPVTWQALLDGLRLLPTKLKERNREREAAGAAEARPAVADPKEGEGGKREEAPAKPPAGGDFEAF